MSGLHRLDGGYPAGVTDLLDLLVIVSVVIVSGVSAEAVRVLCLRRLATPVRRRATPRSDAAAETAPVPEPSLVAETAA